MHPQIRGSPLCQVRSQIIRHHLDSLLSKAKIYPCMPAYFFICSCYFLLEELQDTELLLEDSPWFLFIPALRLSSDPLKSIFSYPALWCWARSFANEAFHFASWFSSLFLADTTRTTYGVGSDLQFHLVLVVLTPDPPFTAVALSRTFHSLTV